jgi:hypothetical protein
MNSKQVWRKEGNLKWFNYKGWREFHETKSIEEGIQRNEFKS